MKDRSRDRSKDQDARVPDPAFNDLEDREEVTLRPRLLSEFIG
jgi:hypothetical protein